MFLHKNSGLTTTILVLLLSTWLLAEASAMKYWWLNPVGKRVPGADRLVFGEGSTRSRQRELGALGAVQRWTGPLGEGHGLKRHLVALRLAERGDHLIHEAAPDYSVEENLPFLKQSLRSVRSSRTLPVGGALPDPQMSPYWRVVGAESSSRSQSKPSPYARMYQFLSQDGGEKITCIGYHAKIPENESSPEDRITLGRR